jgi:hypothetical protein
MSARLYGSAHAVPLAQQRKAMERHALILALHLKEPVFVYPVKPGSEQYAAGYRFGVYAASNRVYLENECGVRPCSLLAPDGFLIWTDAVTPVGTP